MKAASFFLLCILFAGMASASDCFVGDVDGDCEVNLKDIVEMADQWLAMPGDLPELTANLDNTGGVDMHDFVILSDKWLQSTSPVIISEFMASNAATIPLGAGEILDGNGASSDWIELLNISNHALDMGGWHLTDNAGDRQKWSFPAGTTINSGEYVLVFASSKTQQDNPDNYPYVDSLGYLHTNFALARSGDYLALVKPDLSVAHEYASVDIGGGDYGYPEQEANISYGIYENAERFFASPTPEAANDPVYIDFIANVQASHDRGFYTNTISVALQTATQGAAIYYTTDGSEPSISNGTLYESAIGVSKTTTLRAVALKTGWRPSKVDTQTYIFIEDVVGQTWQATLNAGFPALWGSTTPDYGMNQDLIGPGRPYSDSIRDALVSIPTLSIVMNIDDMFGANGIYTNSTRHGVAWERSASVEYIPADGTEDLQIDCGIRIQGGAFRSFGLTRKKSFRLLFKGIYGITKLNFPWFGDDAVDSFDTITIRGGANDAYAWSAAYLTEQYTRDEFGRSLQRASGNVASHGTFVHLYINGIYWGLYNPVERPDHSFAANYFGGEKDNWDAINSGSPTNGDNNAWNRMTALTQQAATSAEAYQALQGNHPDGSPDPATPALLDVTNYVDYLIVNLWAGNWDWPWKNWWACRDRTGVGTGFKFFCWDSENTIGNNRNRSPLNKNALNNNFSSAGVPHTNLRQNAEYRLLFADRIHRLLFNDGVLTPPDLIDRYSELAARIETAIIGESARWGDEHHQPSLTQAEWYNERDWILNTYLPQRSDIVLQQFRDANLYPNIDAPVFHVNGAPQHAGAAAVNDVLTMKPDPGGPETIWYTLDGTDPHLPVPGTGGGPSDSAEAYSTEIPLTISTHVKARVLDGSEWSALNEAAYSVGPIARSLRITEMMYHPADAPEGSPYNDEDFEFIELKNIGAVAINLKLVRFTNGIDFAFGDTPLAENGYVIVVSNQTAFRSRYDTFAGTIAGEYTGRLDNGGERIELLDAAGGLIQNFRYNDNWYDITDGGGFSLAIKDPAGNDPNAWDNKRGWRPSAEIDGSPGADDPNTIPELGSIVINEVLAHSPDLDPDWIELHNTTTDQAINLKGWFLSDSASDLKKYEILTDTIIDPNGYAVFYENLHFGQSASDPGRHTPFAISENGETINLTSGKDGVLTGYTDEEDLDASETDVSFGRYQKSTGAFNFVAMSAQTPGRMNADPKVGAIVMSEIMYHPIPGTFDKEEYEYIELYNTTDSAVQLYEYDADVGSDIPWKFTDGVEYTFPPDTEIAPYGYLLVVKNTTAFAERHGSPAGVEVLGPYDKKLNNDGEKLELAMPGDTDAEGRHYIRIDRVVYNDAGDWPSAPDGAGMSLTRTTYTAYGNDPINWHAATATPGW